MFDCSVLAMSISVEEIMKKNLFCLCKEEGFSAWPKSRERVSCMNLDGELVPHQYPKAFHLHSSTGNREQTSSVI